MVLTGCSGRVSPARSPLSCSGMRSSRLPPVSRPPRWRSGSTGPGIAAGSASPSPHEVSYKKSIEISTDQATVVCFVACFTHVCIYWHFSLASRILCSYSYMTVRHSTYWHFSLASSMLCNSWASAAVWSASASAEIPALNRTAEAEGLRGGAEPSAAAVIATPKNNIS